MSASWIYSDEAEEIIGGEIPEDADIISHVCQSDGLTIFERESVERYANSQRRAILLVPKQDDGLGLFRCLIYLVVPTGALMLCAVLWALT